MQTTKRLSRSSQHNVVAGVAGGIAEYLNVDPTLIRIAFVLATLMGGPGLLLYIILWIVMPQD